MRIDVDLDNLTLKLEEGGKLRIFDLVERKAEQKNISAMLAQVLAVVRYVQQRYTPSTTLEDAKLLTIAGVKSVAADKSVTVQSVLDKCSRKLSLTSEQFQTAVYEFLAHGSGDLEKTLRKAIENKRSYAADNEAIDLFFGKDDFNE